MYHFINITVYVCIYVKTLCENAGCVCVKCVRVRAKVKVCTCEREIICTLKGKSIYLHVLKREKNV